MKKALGLGILLAAGVAYAFASAAWTRGQFVQEVDGYLASPRDLNSATFPDLILMKAKSLELALERDQIQLEIRDAERPTTTSKHLTGKGVAVQTQVMTLQIQYAQTIMGFKRYFRLDRERTFTSGAALPQTAPPLPPSGPDLP